MKKRYSLMIAVIIATFAAADLFAQQQVMVRDLHTYDTVPASQAELPDHPLTGVDVEFDAVIVSYPKNSGLASITSAGVPGRIHVFVTDVNAIEEGREGNTIQIVVAGDQRETLEGLFTGDVIRVTGELTFFGNVSQFNATDVELLGSITDSEFEDLAPLLEPTVINLTDLNQQSAVQGQHRWIAENYTTYINRYVKLEGMEVIGVSIQDTGRPWYILSDGTTVITSNDTSLRFRNDRSNYAYDPAEDEGLGYNYRRLATDLDGPFTPPAPGSIVDVSGFVVLNTFDPGGFDEATAQTTFNIAPWDDGVVWQNDGENPADRITPEGWPNDFVVLGFAPILTDFEVSPDPAETQILNDTEVTVSVDVLLPEVDYTLQSVQIEYMIYPYTEDSSELVVADMTNTGGDTYSFTFDAQDNFTTVEFQVVATATTPDGIETFGREDGSYFVESTTQTSPPMFTPPAGDYSTSISVQLSSATPGATIHYTLDGSTPDESSPVYTSGIELLDAATVTAIAVSNGLDNSPVNSRFYSVDVDLIEVETLAELRAGIQGGTLYQYTGEAVVTYARSTRNQKYLMDSSGGILIDDPGTVITSPYQVGDVMTGMIGSLGSFQGVIQFLPGANPGNPESTMDVVPQTLALNDITVSDHESMLILVENVMFDTDQTEFSGGQNYDLVDASLGDDETVTFRTNFPESNYIGQEIPTDEFNLTALVGNFNGNLQLIARSDADFGGAVSNENETSPYQFRLAQNYPNPFNPSTRINYELAQTTDVRLVVYDILGRRVATLVNEVQNSGFHTVNFDMSRFASGTYIYRLEAGDFVSVKKMMLIK